MSDAEERSASGIPLLRHRETERNVEMAEGDEALDAAVTAHLTQHVGEPGEVWHELVSPSAFVLDKKRLNAAVRRAGGLFGFLRRS